MNEYMIAFSVLLLSCTLAPVTGIEELWATPPPVEGGGAKYTYETKWFKQRVDHFGFTNEDHYLQRYLINDTYWDHNQGPIFFYTGNEGDIEAFTQNSVSPTLIEMNSAAPNILLSSALGFHVGHCS
jgi:hypothetical protein